jgi:hypothetical protein
MVTINMITINMVTINMVTINMLTTNMGARGNAAGRPEGQRVKFGRKEREQA